MATTSIPATCQAVTNSLLLESGRYGPGIFQRAARKRPIIRLQSKTRGAWLNGMGVTLGAVTFERMMPDTLEGVWAAVAQSDGDAVNACLPPADTVTFGATNRTYSPDHQAIDSDYFCIRDIQFDWQYAEMLSNITKGFANTSEWVWAARYTNQYVKLAGHHLTLNTTHGEQDNPTWDSTDFGYNTTNVANARLSQGVLNDIYMDLFREGADLPSGLSESTNEAVFTLITSAETSRNIIRNNPQLASDNQYAYMGSKDMPLSPLLPGMATRRRVYGGYMHEIDPYPRKFVVSGGHYVQVAPFVKTSTTKGYKWEQNPAYKAAIIVESIIWHEENYQSLAVNTVTNPAPGWQFNPHDWMGAFEPRNILERTCNPDGTMIYWRALFADASKPVNPKVGYSILSLECPNNIDLKDCNGAYVTYGA